MIWNLANSSSALIDEDTKIDGYFIKSDGYKDVVLPLMGALDPVRAAKYEAENWSDLTVEELAENVPYFDSVMSVNVEGGTASELTVENRRDDPDGEAFCSIVIPDTIELHGFDGAFNYIDSDGNYVKNWERADKTTDGAGAFALTGYASGSKVICRNKTSGEVEVLDAAASVTTSWTETDIEILYRLATAVESIVQLESTGFMLYPGDNNVLSPDSKTPVAIQVSDYTGVSSTSSTQAFIERFRATTKRGGRTFQPYGSRVLKSVPTSEEVAISLSKMNIDDETIGLALDDGHFQIENTYVNVNDGSEITDTYKHCRITSHGKEYSAGDIVKEDVEIECAKVVTS